MRGLAPVLWLVIAIVVFLVAALVVLGVFGAGLAQVGSIAEATSICSAQYSGSCAAFNAEPSTWNTPTMRVNDIPSTCLSILSCSCTDRKATCTVA